ncbi:hypothetical protein TTHERM_01151540 (macronuclear) [Tetrahymena thermophila SB210]|uniref:Uncharacterized protein n=1 Tax=Tetrahymena thermophila (strain SB210) TaxID=312017 RepID=Q22AV6_TETTS|nr:hypothetical protein TTHERM_01151540 [Tetrahymena thermophila SB210]EAR82423.2 hypothetical protein TTHERM_01151540 [Tetrahymena thermophila SB210]|eukprot:XP_001030086.2 hypothetical protein TTHERM_01151540 [Tetrahymena thermophila SB210]
MYNNQIKKSSLDLNNDSIRGGANYGYTASKNQQQIQQRLKNMIDQQSTLKRHGSYDNRQFRNTFDFDNSYSNKASMNKDTKNYLKIQPFQVSSQQTQNLDYTAGYQSLSPISRQIMKKKMNQSLQLQNESINNTQEYDFQAESANQQLGYFQVPLQSPQNNNLKSSQIQQQGPNHQYINLSNYSNQQQKNQVIQNNQIPQMSQIQQPQITMTTSTFVPPNQQNNLQKYYFSSPMQQNYMVRNNKINQSVDLSQSDNMQLQMAKKNLNYSLIQPQSTILSGNSLSMQKVNTLPTEMSDISYDNKCLNNRIDYLYQENQQLTNELQDTLNQSKQYQQQYTDQLNQHNQLQQIYNPKMNTNTNINSSMESLSNRMVQENLQNYSNKREQGVFMNQEQVENIQNQLDEIKQYLQKQNTLQKGDFRQSTIQSDLLLNKIMSQKKNNESLDEFKEALASTTSVQNLSKRQSALQQALSINLNSSRLGKMNLKQSLNNQLGNKVVIQHIQTQLQNKSQQSIESNPNANNNQSMKDLNNDHTNVQIKNNNHITASGDKNDVNLLSMSNSIRSKNQSIQKSDQIHQNTKNTKSTDMNIQKAIKSNLSIDKEDIKKRLNSVQNNRTSQSQDYYIEPLSKETIDSALDVENESTKTNNNQENKIPSQNLSVCQQNLTLQEQLQQKEEQIKKLDQQILQLQQEQVQIKINYETEKSQLKNENILLEGRIKQKEQFEEERIKHEEIIKEQQMIMKQNQDSIIQELQSKNQNLVKELQQAEKNNQDLQAQLQNYQKQQKFLSSSVKEKDQLIEKIKKDNQNLIEQKNIMDFNMGASGNMMGSYQQQINLEQMQKQFAHVLEMKDREIMELKGMQEQLTLKIKSYEEQLNQITNSDQQSMMKQIQISKGTIDQLSQQIERYKQELHTVQLSIPVNQSQQRFSKNGSKQTNDSELIKQYHALQYQCDALKANNDQLKAKEMEYEQSINKLKAGYYEESEARKELENKIKLISQKSNAQQQNTIQESAGYIVKELIQRKKNENNPSNQLQFNQISGEGLNDNQLLKEIINGLTIQMNENQQKYDDEKEKLQADIRKLKNELESKKQECQKNVLEINRLNKELEFSEIKETLNDREEEMTQLKQKIEELQKQIRSLQEKHLNDKNQIIKENENYVDRLKKEYEERINYYKQSQNGGQLPSSTSEDNKLQSEAHINCLEQINALSKELATCKQLYQRALNDEMVQTQQLINSLNNAILEKRDKIDKIEEQKGEMQSQISNFNSQYKQLKENLLTASMSVTLESSHVLRDGQCEILKNLIDKVKDKKQKAQEKAKQLEKENKRLLEESKRLQQTIKDVEIRNSEIENQNHVSQQELVILQERIKDYVEEDKKKSQEIELLKSQVSQIGNKSNKHDLENTIGLTQNDNQNDNFQLMDINSQSLVVHDESERQTQLKILDINDELAVSEQPKFQIEVSKSRESLNSILSSKHGGPIVIDQVYKQNIAKEYDILLNDHTQLQKKYKVAYAQLQEKLKSEAVLQGMIKTENAKRKTLENNYKKLQEDYDKLEKIKKANSENIKKLQQKNVQNESIKEFFENQMKEYKDVIEKLQHQKKELEDKLKSKLQTSMSNVKASSMIEASYYNSTSNIGESSIVEPEKLLNDLQDKINENCMLNMKIDELNEQIKVLTLHTQQDESNQDKQTSIQNLMIENQALKHKVQILTEENEQLKNQVDNYQIEAQLGGLETSDLKVQCNNLQAKISEQQDIMIQNNLHIESLQQQINHLKELLIKNQIDQEIQMCDQIIKSPSIIQDKQNEKSEIKQDLKDEEEKEEHKQKQIQIPEQKLQVQNIEASQQQNNPAQQEINPQNMIEKIQIFNEYMVQDDFMCQSSEFNQYNQEQCQKEASVLKDLTDLIKNI